MGRPSISDKHAGITNDFCFMNTRTQLMISVALGAFDWIYFAQYSDSFWAVIVNETNNIIFIIPCYFLVLNTFLIAPLSLASLVYTGFINTKD